MKKVIRVTDLHQLESRKSKNALITVVRHGKSVWTQNLELIGAELTHNLEKDEVSINFKLREGEMLVLSDEEGMAPKMVWNEKLKVWEKQ